MPAKGISPHPQRAQLECIRARIRFRIDSKEVAYAASHASWKVDVLAKSGRIPATRRGRYSQGEPVSFSSWAVTRRNTCELYRTAPGTFIRVRTARGTRLKFLRVTEGSINAPGFTRGEISAQRAWAGHTSREVCARRAQKKGRCIAHPPIRFFPKRSLSARKLPRLRGRTPIMAFSRFFAKGSRASSGFQRAREKRK